MVALGYSPKALKPNFTCIMHMDLRYILWDKVKVKSLGILRQIKNQLNSVAENPIWFLQLQGLYMWLVKTQWAFREYFQHSWFS